MYTQCPECGTVFRVTATVLRAARGQVRCGVCDANFDALRTLRDAPDDAEAQPTPKPAPPPPPPAPTATARPTPPPSPAPPATTAPTASPRPPAPAPSPATAPPPAAPAARPPPPAIAPKAPASISPPAPPAPKPEPAAGGALKAPMAPLRPEPTPAANALPPRPPPPPPPPPESDPADADISEEINILDAGDVEEIVLAGDDGSADDVEEINLEFDAPGDAWEQVFIDDEPAPEAVLADAPNTRQPRAAPPGARAVGPDEDTISSTDEFEALNLDADDLEFPLEPVAEAAPAPVRAPPPAPMAPAPKPAPAVATPERVPPPKAPAPAVPAVAPRPAPAPAPAPAPLAAPAPVVPRELAPPPPAAQMDTGAYIKKALGELNSPPGTLARIKQRAALIRMAQTAGALLLALLLVAQFVNYSRDALAEAPLIGKALVALYARAGIVVEPRWDLTAYDVRQWGAGSDAEPGTLRLRASVINRARRGQPYPLLRVTLEDRFGGKIARREFAAQEYLPGRAAPEGLLAPGARADADLKLADPGREAVGFELDICLPHQGALICGADQKAAAGG